MPIEKRDVMFKSGETFAAAWFFVPEQVRSSGRVPAVAMAHGIGAVKEMSLEQFARRFAAAGIAALVFDYRGLGGSGGEPRQRIFPHDQMEDYRNALPSAVSARARVTWVRSSSTTRGSSRPPTVMCMALSGNIPRAGAVYQWAAFRTGVRSPAPGNMPVPRAVRR
jgi:alpha-beta hydrolase superfamily lysophospholipase